MRLKPTDIRDELVAIDTLKPHPRNPNNGDLEVIEASVREHGVYRAVVISKDGFILAGNHTYAAAMAAGEKELKVHVLPLMHDDPQALKIMVADNGTRRAAREDKGLLAELLQGMEDLDGTGYDEGYLSDLLEEVNAGPGDVSTGGETEYNPEAVIKYTIVFDNLDQQSRWHNFLKDLRRQYPGEDETIASRLYAFLGDLPA